MRRKLQDKQPRTSSRWTDQVKVRILGGIQKNDYTQQEKKSERELKRRGDYADSAVFKCTSH